MARGTAGRWGDGETRAKDSDRQDACKILDNALNDGELSMEEHRERVSAATNAVTLGDLQALVADLQTDSSPLHLPAVKGPPVSSKFGGRGMVAIAFVVSVLLGVGIGWGLYGNTTSPLDFTTDPGAKPDGVGRRGADPAHTAAFGRRADRPDGANAQTVRQHHGLSAGDLPDVRGTGPSGSLRRPPGAGLHLPRRLGRPDQLRQELQPTGPSRWT